MPKLDDKSKLLLNLIQDEFPLVERPYKLLGEKLAIAEAEVLARIAALSSAKLLRQISAIFDTRRLGYQSCLAACKTLPDNAEQAAAVISFHPGVSHNYARAHAFNIWFTIAVPGASSLQAHLDKLQAESGALVIRALPALRLFKIGVKLDMSDEGGSAAALPTGGAGRKPSFPEMPAQLTDSDINFVRALQENFEVRPDPFTPIAQKLGTTPQAVLDWCRAAIQAGYLRRVAGVIYHRQAGFSANAMGVWQIPEERIEEVGAFFAQQAAITHCYLRPTYPDWPYNIFTMSHGRSRQTCNEMLAHYAKLIGIANYSVLYSTKEYKKIRLKYFTGEVERWEETRGLRLQQPTQRHEDTKTQSI